MSHCIRSLGLIALAAPALAFPAHAQDIDADALTRDRVTVGVGAASVPRYEGADENRIVPAPFAQGSISGFSFALVGTRLSVDLVPSSGGIDFQAGPVVNVNLNRTDDKHLGDARVEALGKIDTAVELGGYVGIGKTGVLTSDYDKITLSVSYIHDVTDTHDSYVITPGLNYSMPLSRKLFVGLEASAQYVGNGYARTYFGVTPAQSAASTLPVYDPGDGWKSWNLGGLANYSLTGDLTGGLSLVVAGNYRRIIGDFADSPLVAVAGDRDQWTGAVGLAYTF